MEDVTLTDNTARQRYELLAAGAVVAYTQYELPEGAVKFVHTEVPPAYEGRGFGSELARLALDDVRSRGLRVIPVCPFIAGYIRRHPPCQSLVGEDDRRRFKI